MFHRSFAFSALILLAIAGLVAGCGGSGGDGGNGSDGPATPDPMANVPVVTGADGVLRFPLADEPKTFDPAIMTGVPEGRVAMNIFEGLWMSTRTGMPPVEYGVARAHTVSEDGLTWTITLRDDCKWTNGDPVTAHDFAFAWRRVLDPATGADYADQLHVIRNAKPFNSGEIPDWSQVGVTVTEDGQLVIQLETPVPFLDQLLAFYTWFPVHQATVEAHGEQWTRPANIVSNGAYTLSEHILQQHVLLEKWDGWHRADEVTIETIRMPVIADNDRMLSEYEQGKIDMVLGGIPVGKVPGLRGRADFRLDPLLGSYYYRVNLDSDVAALKDKRVRQALSLAINREALCNRGLKRISDPAAGFVPPMVGYETGEIMDSDPETARQLLAEAGYPGGEGFPTISLLYNTDDNHKLIAELIQDMWSRELNIGIELENTEWKVYLERVSNQDYEMARAGWIADYNDPETFLIIFTTGNGNNSTGWSNARYDEIVLREAREAGGTRRMELLREAEQILLDELPIIPIYFYKASCLVNPRVDYEAHPRQLVQFRFLALND